MEVNILVADDEPGIGMMITNSMELYGYKVVRTDSVKSAIELLETNAYDVLVVDKNMPGLAGAKEGGLELLRYVKTNVPNTEVIIMTGYPSIESTVGAIKLGAFDYLTKPFLIKELKEKIDRVVEHKNFVNSKSPLQTLTSLRTDITDLLSKQNGFTNNEILTSLKVMESKIDFLFNAQSELERISPEQKEALYNIQTYAEQLKANLHQKDPAYLLVQKIWEESHKVIKPLLDAKIS